MWKQNEIDTERRRLLFLPIHSCEFIVCVTWVKATFPTGLIQILVTPSSVCLKFVTLTDTKPRQLHSPSHLPCSHFCKYCIQISSNYPSCHDTVWHTSSDENASEGEMCHKRQRWKSFHRNSIGMFNSARCCRKVHLELKIRRFLKTSRFQLSVREVILLWIKNRKELKGRQKVQNSVWGSLTRKIESWTEGHKQSVGKDLDILIY